MAAVGARIGAAGIRGEGDHVSVEAIAVVGAAVALLAVLVPLMLFLHGRVAGRIKGLA